MHSSSSTIVLLPLGAFRDRKEKRKRLEKKN